MPKYGMVIDLQKCVGCGGCAIACKTENNTQDASNGQSFNWADFQEEVSGRFPNMKYANRPVLCNHCENAKCVEVCPVTPKAMHKHPNGMTIHNNERCIGCRMCQEACPYSVMDLEGSGAQYSVISFNAKDPHAKYRNETALIAGCTASGAEMAKLAGSLPPGRTEYSHGDYKSVRKGGIVEKCMFCEHRVSKGELPYCVEACPSGARIFGDQADPNSEIAKVLREHKAEVLKPEAKTSPNVFYIRSFSA